MRPPFGYHGGKQRLADWIVSLMPPHQTYVEPFAGSLAVLLAKPPAPVEVVNDLDGEVVNFWRVLRDRPHDLERVCALTPYARAEYDAAFDPTDEPLERARRWWTRIEQGVAHKHSRSGWHSAGARFVATARNHVDRMGPAAERIAQVAIDCRDAVDVIDQFDGPDTLIYCDPPYVAATHSSRGAYRHGMDDAAHRRLADRLLACAGTVMVSGYPSGLYDELFSGWHVNKRANRAYTANRSGPSKQTVEVVWSNRPVGRAPSLFDEVTAG